MITDNYDSAYDLVAIRGIERNALSRAIRNLVPIRNPSSADLSSVSTVVSKLVFRERLRGKVIAVDTIYGAPTHTQEALLKDLNRRLEVALRKHKLDYLCKFIQINNDSGAHDYGFVFIDATLIGQKEELVDVLRI